MESSIRNKLERYPHFTRYDKQELLNDMVVFQEERNRLGKLTPDLIEWGVVLYDLLTKFAETLALEKLSRTYHRHLLEEQKKIKYKGFKLIQGG